MRVVNINALSNGTTEYLPIVLKDNFLLTTKLVFENSTYGIFNGIYMYDLANNRITSVMDDISIDCFCLSHYPHSIMYFDNYNDNEIYFASLKNKDRSVIMQLFKMCLDTFAIKKKFEYTLQNCLSEDAYNEDIPIPITGRIKPMILKKGLILFLINEARAEVDFNRILLYDCNDSKSGYIK